MKQKQRRLGADIQGLAVPAFKSQGKGVITLFKGLAVPQLSSLKVLLLYFKGLAVRVWLYSILLFSCCFRVPSLILQVRSNRVFSFSPRVIGSE